jgi:Flp pilus assembly protein TadD
MYVRSFRASLGVRAPETLDETSARELAVKQGLGIVLSGAVERRGSGYTISVKASETVSGKEIVNTRARAASKNDVVGTATKLVTTVRKALGDEASESNQLFAMASLSATSLDVVRLYSSAQNAASNGKFEEARRILLEAVKLDPQFGVGYQLLAVASRNLGQLQDAERYINEALRHITGMTERERLTTRGYFYRVTGDYQQCVKEYGDLISRYAADVVGRNQLALCSSQLRDLRRAVDEMRQVVKLLPKRAVFRENLALYANYASDFQLAEREARRRRAGRLRPLAWHCAAGQGQHRMPPTHRRSILGPARFPPRAWRPGPFQGRQRQDFEQGGGRHRGEEPRPPREAGCRRVRAATARAEAPGVAAADCAGGQQSRQDQFLAGRTFIETGETRGPSLIAASPRPCRPNRGLREDPRRQDRPCGGDAREAIRLMVEATRRGHVDWRLRA